MSIFQAAVLGLVQGLTEFLPISSSGHLIFIPRFFGWPDQGLAFDAFVHLGTLVAVVVYFRKRLWEIAQGFFSRGPASQLSRRLGWLLLFSIIPAGLVGFFGEEWIERTLRSTTIIAIGLIGWGVVLWFADRYNKEQEALLLRQLADTQGQAGHKEQLTDTYHMSWKQVLFVACAQALALIPGTSRSGITMTAGLFAKLDKKSAAEFSFLMSVPIIAIAGGLKLIELLQSGLAETDAVTLSVGFLAAALSGFFAIAGLMRIIQKWSFTPFVVYRVMVGLAILIFLS